MIEIDYTEFQDTINASTAAGPLDFSPYSNNDNEEYMNDAQVEHFSPDIVKLERAIDE